MKPNQPSGIALAYLRHIVLPYKIDACLIWPLSCNNQGYAQMRHNGKNRLVARVVCEIVHGPSNLDTRHLCGRGAKGCVSPQHVVWGTKSENEADKIIHGTSNRGVGNSQAKLTESQVLEIRGAHGSQRAIAERYNVSQSTISLIKSGVRWVWL